MGYDFQAWLERSGTPQLKIVDNDTGCIGVARALNQTPAAS